MEKVLWLTESVKSGLQSFTQDAAPWSGRSDDVDTDQIKALIESNQHYTTWERADILEMYIPSVQNHMYQLDDVHSLLWYLAFMLSKKKKKKKPSWPHFHVQFST